MKPSENQTKIEQNIYKNLLGKIDPRAIGLIKYLREHGFRGYLVGGAIRDLLNDDVPRDFDIVTEARPEQVAKLFAPMARIVGRRFRLVHVCYEKKIFEVSTLRKGTASYRHRDGNGLICSDNDYGSSIKVDSNRRDITINSIYYDPLTNKIFDYVGGAEDFAKKIIRVIGDPSKRFLEDPIRILRVYRFAARLGFTVESKTQNVLERLISEIHLISPIRLYGHILKDLSSGYSYRFFQNLGNEGILNYLWPALYEELGILREEHDCLLEVVLKNNDERIRKGLPISATLFFAVFLWTLLEKRMAPEKSCYWRKEKLENIATEIIKEASKVVAIPKFLKDSISRIWQLQIDLEKEKRGKIEEDRHFRTGYHLFRIRSKNAPDLLSALNCWTRIYKLQGRSAK